MVVIDVDTRQLAERGKEIYKKLKDELEPKYKGKIMAIEVDSGDYFIDNSVSDRNRKAKEKHPNKIFHFVKIGYPVVYHLYYEL